MDSRLPDIRSIASVQCTGASSNLERRMMNLKIPAEVGGAAQKAPTQIPVLLTPKEAATRLKVSPSWMAKARLRGDGPPYIKVGKSIRYPEPGLLQWMKARTRTSTSEV